MAPFNCSTANASAFLLPILLIGRIEIQCALPTFIEISRIVIHDVTGLMEEHKGEQALFVYVQLYA
jgi:hypothetical protein